MCVVYVDDSKIKEACDTAKMSLSSFEQKEYEDGMMQHFSSDSCSSMRSLSSKSRSASAVFSSNSSKPVIAKRRSRVSRKTPITHLNANASNFRTLVQQFTGCPTTPLSLGVPFKGPITLNFQRGIREMQTLHHHHHHNNNNNNNNNITTPTNSHHHHHHVGDNQVLHVLFRNQNQSQVISDHDHGQDKQIIDVDDDDDCTVMMMQKTSTGDVDSSSCSSSSAGSSSTPISGLDPELSHHHHHLLTEDFDGFMDDFSLHDLIDMNNAFSNDLGYFV